MEEFKITANCKGKCGNNSRSQRLNGCPFCRLTGLSVDLKLGDWCLYYRRIKHSFIGIHFLYNKHIIAGQNTSISVENMLKYNTSYLFHNWPRICPVWRNHSYIYLIKRNISHPCLHTSYQKGHFPSMFTDILSKGTFPIHVYRHLIKKDILHPCVCCDVISKAKTFKSDTSNLAISLNNHIRKYNWLFNAGVLSKIVCLVCQYFWIVPSWLFLLLPFFFWSLCCLSYSDLLHLINPLVSSSFFSIDILSIIFNLRFLNNDIIMIKVILHHV